MSASAHPVGVVLGARRDVAVLHRGADQPQRRDPLRIPGLDRFLQIPGESLADHSRTLRLAPARSGQRRHYISFVTHLSARLRPAAQAIDIDACLRDGTRLDHRPRAGVASRAKPRDSIHDRTCRPLGPGAGLGAGRRAEADRLHRARRRAGVLRPRLRGDRRRGGRALLQHRDDRLPGDHDRSVLRRADRHLHLPPHRQRRGQPRGRRDRRPVRRRHGGEVGPDRAVELARRRRPRRTGWPGAAASASAASTPAA